MAVLIPIIATAMAVGIGISIGTTFIQVHNAFNEDATLITAVSLTAIIMAIAGGLSYMDTKRPAEAEPRATRATDRPRRAEPSGARRPNTARPARGRSRSNDRRKPD